MAKVNQNMSMSYQHINELKDVIATLKWSRNTRQATWFWGVQKPNNPRTKKNLFNRNPHASFFLPCTLF